MKMNKPERSSEQISSSGSIRQAAAQRQADTHPETASISYQDNRSASIAQRQLQRAIDQSPRQRTQTEQLAGLFGSPLQRQLVEEDEKPLQGRFEQGQTVQLEGPNRRVSENRTGMPDRLKSGMEALSDMDLSEVRVHRNSDKPAQLNALAYAQGNEIHLGPGQERHLPHEAWHVVQQRQGRVSPTMQMAGVGVNDDKGLEREADLMGGRAVQMAKAMHESRPEPINSHLEPDVTQVGQKTLQAQSESDTFSPRQNGSIAASVIQGEFKDSAEVRREKFIDLAQKTYNLSLNNAEELYSLSGGNDPDPVTRLRTSTDKEESESVAREYAKQGAQGQHGDKVFYTKIKFYNLAGLNAARGHAGADRIFGMMAAHVNDSLQVLSERGYKVQGYRHEGSRFGFMIVGDAKTLTKETIDDELKKAKLGWEQIKKEQDLANIANPKQSGRPGVDLGFNIFEVTGERAQVEKEQSGDQAQGPADVGLSPERTHKYQGPAPGIFKGQATARHDTFKQKAQELGLKPNQVEALYKVAGRAEKEALTGFDQAGDRIGTLLKAMRYFKQKFPSIFAGYVEVDVRNLGGLNDNLTRGDSDNVFRFMSDTTDKHVRSLKADVVSFRHGGDEFSFVVVGYIKDVIILDLRAVLDQAQLAIDAYVQHKKLWQKQKKSFDIKLETNAEITLLNQHKLPPNFAEPFSREKIMKNQPVIKTNTANELWSVYGKETYWLISHEGPRFRVIHIPLELTLNEILHSKDSPQKPREPGTGIVWGASPVLKSDVDAEDMSPIDVIARADQAVEQKKQ